MEFRLPEAVPRSGQISYDALTKRVEAISGVAILMPNLRRLVRQAMTNHVFVEPEAGFVAHNKTSLLFLDDKVMASWVGMFTMDLFIPVANTIAAMKKWPCSQIPNETVCHQNLGWIIMQ